LISDPLFQIRYLGFRVGGAALSFPWSFPRRTIEYGDFFFVLSTPAFDLLHNDFPRLKEAIESHVSRSSGFPPPTTSASPVNLSFEHLSARYQSIPLGPFRLRLLTRPLKSLSSHDPPPCHTGFHILCLHGRRVFGPRRIFFRPFLAVQNPTRRLPLKARCGLHRCIYPGPPLFCPCTPPFLPPLVEVALPLRYGS